MAGHHHHHHIDPSAGDAKVFWAVVVNLGLTVAQVIGGLLSGSLALIADAIHNLSDALSLVIAFFARKVARRPANEKMTYGYGRAEIVAALVNYTTLILIGLYLVYEAMLRFLEPTAVEGWLVVVIAGVALVIDAVTALLTFSLSKHSVNMRAAFLHNVADALGSIAVIGAGTLILLYDWRLVDPIVTLLIAGYILWQSFTEIGAVIRILMLGSPPEMDTQQVLAEIADVEGVAGVHHLHFWQMQEHENAVDAHLVIASGQWRNADAVKEAVRAKLRDKFAITHATLETECSLHACPDPRSIGHHEDNVPQRRIAHDH
ncbi:cation diffusion facilitator family transporter [Limibacillus halophilus]|uniref:Cobalt-zinc-cadmium efflux system protein n=1 Tax=Limibacillus halophilus TaxID=1579333 RepID=A0A839SR76_9PROT|nr:cation diffusion facilitator family transporter [Limibacillus halophilus]MBB3064992.1 cobalt-zinc-cadmium efflux system protein [Limibacillus halophilus]